MSLKFCSFASGSSGNCYLIKNDSSALLIDAGISGKKIFQGLLDTDTPHENVKGLLVTHEHIDHVKSLPIVTKKLPNIHAYANDATWASIDRPVAAKQQQLFRTGKDFYIDDFRIKPFPIPHDAAEPVGFSLYYEDKQISIVYVKILPGAEKLLLLCCHRDVYKRQALEALAGLIRSSGFRFIDLNSKYRECGKYLDGVHPLPEGHRFIADIISEYIKRSNTI